MYDSNPIFYGTGRRKKSVARVRVYPARARSPLTIGPSMIISALKR